MTFYSFQCSFCTAERLHFTVPSPRHHSGMHLLAQLTKLSQEAPSYLRRLWGKMSLDQDFCKCVNLRRTNVQLVFNRTDRTLWSVSESHPLPPHFFQIFCLGSRGSAIARDDTTGKLILAGVWVCVFNHFILLAVASWFD